MSIRIKYAYLHGQVWMFRRNYPADVALVLGSKALKRSLKTSDPKVAKARSLEVNAIYEEQVSKARSGINVMTATAQSGSPAEGLGAGWDGITKQTVARLRASLEASGTTGFTGTKRTSAKVGDLAKTYLRKRAQELRPGGYKSVRYSVGLFASKFAGVPVSQLGRDEGRFFLDTIPDLSRVIGKSEATRRMGFDRLIEFSRRRNDGITVRTQKRIWSQVKHFLDWAVYEGEIDQNPFRTVRFERKVRPAPYAVPTDAEVARLLAAEDKELHHALLFCLLTGMRSGEAVGLLRDDLVRKGNLGWFALVRPNAVRELKTDASARQVPLHPVLQDLLPLLPAQGELFPELNVNLVTKQFTKLRDRLELSRPGLVFHSTRKWFITQCERTGVPEHFTASLVGHKSARSENQLTYGIYSAGISDEQQRSIIDQIRLPA
ncbi:Phage integrase family protein [Loktanella sp. DSM 29012]|uniref:DUF6538 domain-containing protein n=1 Tax=Loktanella sp. DSM 29012 TaxID=1881056 RepID=UPI0008C8C35E|nr:DUF6538 domain-containing protein [Loktanella sp. DSM 29012]SEQ89040.1 Phage integrase family protein [Loktanella sp. DSM 29012]